MQNRTRAMEEADLEVRLGFPDGLDGVAAQLVIRCRKSNLTIAEVDLADADLVNLLSRRSDGAIQGKSRTLAEYGRSFVNKERVMVSVRLPSAVDVFEPDDSRHVIAWGLDVARAYNAHDYRIKQNREGYTFSLIYFSATASDNMERRYLQHVEENLKACAARYAQQAVEKKAQQR